MTKICITPPTVLAVTLAQAKTNLRVDGSALDETITLWVKGVIAALEHEICQCLMEQTWEVRLRAFPSIQCHRIGAACAGSVPNAIALPHPAMSVTSVKYLDRDGAEQTMAPAGYKLTVNRYESFLTPARGASWPATADEEGAVVVTLQCGYGNTPDKTPENVQLYILAKLVEQFDPVTRAERDTVQSIFVTRLLDACRSYS